MSVTESIRKEAAEQLAAYISRRENSIPDILEKMEAFRIQHATETPSLSPVVQQIGIWKEEHGTGAYVRDKKQMGEWIKWASQHRISLTTDNKRILLTGESVARGSFYGNEYAPAAVIEHVLSSVAGGEFEVTDLAKSGMEPDEMRSVLKSAAVLQPAMVVIMAGNNFFYKLYGGFLNTRLASDLPVDEISCKWLKEKVDNALSLIVKDFLQYLQELFVQRGVPVLFVIPAFNLADWKVTAHETSTPVLSAGDTALWEQLWNAAREAHKKQDYAGVQKWCDQLLQMDDTQPSIYELMGEAAMAAGHWDEARKYLEAARDYTLLFRSVGKPRILSIVYHTLLSEAKKYGIHTLDLASLLARNTDISIPGRNFFMDYCHMNMAGIQLSMAAVTAAIAEQLQIPVDDPEVFYQHAAAVVPSPEATCMAHIYAAIHNAHYGQEYPIVRFHIEQAFQAVPELTASFCRSYVDMASRRLASPLTRSFSDLFNNLDAGIDKYPEAVFHPVNGKLLDLILTDAMNDVLEEAGEITSGELSALRLSEHAVEQHQEVDLLESFYSRSTYDYFPEQSEYYISRNVRSEFNFFSRATDTLILKIVYRSKHALGGNIKLVLNGRPLYDQLPAAAHWISDALHIPANDLQPGLNKLEIQWPGTIYQPPLEAVLTMRDVLDVLSPVRGELHYLTLAVSK